MVQNKRQPKLKKENIRKKFKDVIGISILIIITISFSWIFIEWLYDKVSERINEPVEADNEDYCIDYYLTKHEKYENYCIRNVTENSLRCPIIINESSGDFTYDNLTKIRCMNVTEENISRWGECRYCYVFEGGRIDK